MSETTPPPKKGKTVLKLMVFSLVLLGLGGGTAYGLLASGVVHLGSAQAAPKGPQLVLKGAEDPYAPPSKSKDETAVVVHGDGGNPNRTAYYSFTEDFTSNLAGSTSLVQMSLAASTERDGRVLMWLDQHQLAVRSRLLVEIANTNEMDVMTPQGKEALQKRLTAAINEVLEEREGFGGVSNVYFRTFIVQ